MFRFCQVFLCVSLVLCPFFVIAKPVNSLEIENSLVNASEFDRIIQRVGGQFGGRPAVRSQIGDLYPKFKQQIMDMVNAQILNADPTLVDSVDSAEKYFNTTIYPLLLSHLAVLKGGNSNLRVEALFKLPSILYRLNLLEFAIKSSQKFKNFNTYKSDLLSKINSKLKEVTVQLDTDPNNLHNLRGLPKLNSTASMVLMYMYQEMLKNVCSTEKNIESFVDHSLQGYSVTRFGCKKPGGTPKGISNKCLPVSMKARLL